MSEVIGTNEALPIVRHVLPAREIENRLAAYNLSHTAQFPSLSAVILPIGASGKASSGQAHEMERLASARLIVGGDGIGRALNQ